MDSTEALDEYIRTRLWILVMIDVASRMPLAWVITENPNAEATLALLRMATRDKTREKLLYNCTNEPAAAVGLMHVKNDNGTGLRNTRVIAALLGSGSLNTLSRAFASTDRTHIERLFGRLEMDLFKDMPGYTGRFPGELPGYDAMANGVITIDQLHKIVSQYFIDEYPSTRHYGVGMGGRRPLEVYKTINATRGQIPPIDPHTRRIQLGWEAEVTPNDEGVRVFTGIWFNSTELQTKREEYGVTGKVKVFVDPDNCNLATVILPKVKDPIEVQLQMTAFADMTLPEILRLMAEHRREDPLMSDFHDDQVMRTRLERRAQIQAIGVEHELRRSYSTVAECKQMGKAVFAGSRLVPRAPIAGTTRPGQITALQPSEGVYRLGISDAFVQEVEPVEISDGANLARPETEASAPIGASNSQLQTPNHPKNISAPPKAAASSVMLQRPKNLKELE